MALSLRTQAVTSSGNGTTSSLSITLPAAIVAGDLLVLQASSGFYAPTLPSGWTQIDSKSTNHPGLIAYKTAITADAGATLTVTFAGSFYCALSAMVVIGAATVRGYLDPTTATVANSTTVGSVAAVAGDLMLYLGQYRNNSSPGVLTLSRGTVDAGISASSDHSTVVGHEEITTGGSISQTFAYPTGQNIYNGYSAVIALQPPAPPSLGTATLAEDIGLAGTLSGFALGTAAMSEAISLAGSFGIGTATLADDQQLTATLSSITSIGTVSLAEDVSLSAVLAGVATLGAATMGTEISLAGALSGTTLRLGAASLDTTLFLGGAASTIGGAPGGAVLTGGAVSVPAQHVEVRLYDETGLGTYTVLTRASAVQWREELSRAGTGQFMIPADDADLVLPRKLVKFYWQGGEQFGIRITADSCQVAAPQTAEVAAQRMVTVSGPGLMSLLGDGSVRPEYGLGRSSGPDRRFGYMSAAGAWYNDPDWYNPPQSVTPLASYSRWPSFPTSFPDPLASWLGAVAVDQYGWFRGTFTTTTDVQAVRLAVCADDDTEWYLDGQQVLTVQGDATVLNSTYTADIAPLSAGPHVLACRVTDAHKWPGEYLQAEVLATLITVLDQSTVLAGGQPIYGPVIYRTGTDWRNVPDVRATPGWRRAQVLRTCIFEAQALGADGPSRFNVQFGDVNDSNNLPWTDRDDFTFPIGTPLDQLAEQLTESEFDLTVDAQQMRLNAWIRAGDDLAQPDGPAGYVELRLAGNLAAYDTSRTLDCATVLLGQLADGTWIEEDHAAGIAAYGRVERRVDLGSTSDDATGRRILRAVFATTTDPAITVTAMPGLLVGATPYADYFVGDTIRIPGHKGIGTTPARVMAINVAQNGETVDAYPELLPDPSSGIVPPAPPPGPPPAAATDPTGVYVS